MAKIIRMLEDREGAYDHIHIVTYVAGEIYSLDRKDPPISQDLLDGFVASGHAQEVDEAGNPIGPLASRRQTKPSSPPAAKTDTTPGEPTPTVREVLAERMRPALAEPDPVSPENPATPGEGKLAK